MWLARMQMEVLRFPKNGVKMVAKVLNPYYAEVIQAKLQQQGILLAGPTTVTALLNALAMGFRTLAINRKATEVWQVLGAAKMQYEKFGDLLQKARKKVDEAGKVLDEADHRNHIIQKHLRRVETLDDPTAAEAVPELFD